ncbi:hypothetical protein Scep_009357 [Stephania cephalantha]|uniref:Transmembrane protein n=1 Tax=Stephania cephalantha TaxID=152367 RepID=A0AAP0PG71_9MAGN
MQQQSSLLFRSQLHLSNTKSQHNIHTIASQTRIPRPPHIDIRPKPPIFCPNRALLISARKNRSRNGFRIPAKTALSRALFVASTLKLLPEPIDFLIREGFGGGDDEGGGVFGGFGGFGFGGFDGWRRRRKRNLGFFLFMLLLLMMVLGLLVCGSRKEFDSFVMFGDLGIGVLLGLILLVNLREFNKGWILGFCSCALMVGLGIKRDELQKWVKRLSVSLPVKRLIGRRGRRKFL